MNDWLEILAIGCSSALVFSVPFAFFAFMRYLRFKETVALAEQGLLRPEPTVRRGRRAHRWGTIIFALGAALTLGLWPIGFLVEWSLPLGLGPWLLPGLLPMAFGGALIYLRRHDEREAPELPAGDEDEWALPPGKG